MAVGLQAVLREAETADMHGKELLTCMLRAGLLLQLLAFEDMGVSVADLQSYKNAEVRGAPHGCSPCGILRPGDLPDGAA